MKEVIQMTEIKILDKTVVSGSPKTGEISTTQIETALRNAVKINKENEILQETLDTMRGKPLSRTRVRKAMRRAEKLNAKYDRDVRMGVIKYNYYNPDECDSEGIRRRHEVEQAWSKANEMEALYDGKHEEYLNIKCYEHHCNIMDSEEIKKLLRERDWDRFQVGAYLRSSEDDQLGTSSNYSVLGDVL